MKIKDSITISVGGKDFEIKSFLELQEIQILVKEVVDVYIKGLADGDGVSSTDDIQGVEGNPILADFAFDVILTNLVSKELSEIDYDILHSNGIHDILEEEVLGAKRARKHIENAIDELNSLERALLKSVSMFVEKIPTTKDMQKLSKSLIKDLSNPKNADVIKNIKDALSVDKEL